MLDLFVLQQMVSTNKLHVTDQLIEDPETYIQ